MSDTVPVAPPERLGRTPPADTRPSPPGSSVADVSSDAGFIPPPVDLPPPLIEGYEILGLLGQGGMGVVYKARQLAADRVVALKMILGGFAGGEARERFRNEAHAVARLQHPNVVQVFEVGEYQGQPYFSLEFCPGGSLEARLQTTPLPAAEAARLVEVLARAMAAAHRQNIVHRDLKPANVLLAADGAPKIADFGLAKKLDDAGKTQPGAVMGSPPYMAPEQALGRTEAIGPLADVYALGAILYECLTGRPPFKAATAVETLVQVVNDEPVAPRRLQPGTPPDLETICLKCLRKEPGRRYAGAEELADDLRRFSAGEPIRARPVGAPERLALWARRRPGVASLAAGVVAALLLGTTVSTCLAVAASQWATKADANAADARNKATQAQNAEQKVREESRQTESALARGLLRPLGHGEGPVNDVELDALWEAATSPNDRIRLLFIEDALSTPAKARQLRNRRELALHAAVGLDRGRRDAVEKLLLDKLRDPKSPPGLRVDCALIGSALGDVGPEFAAVAAPVLAEAAATASPGDLAQEARGLHALAPKLGAEDSAPYATAAALAVVAAIDKDAPERYNLAPALGELAADLRPEDAAKVAHASLDAMTKAEYALKQSADADGLLAVLDRVAPDERAAISSKAGGVLADAMTKLLDEALAPPKDSLFPGSGHVDLMEMVGLASAFRRIVDKLDPQERDKLAAPLERRLADGMVKIHEWLQFGQLGDALGDLPPALPPDAAASSLRGILGDDSEAGRSKRIFGAKAIEAIASRTAPGGGAAVADAIEGGLTGFFSAFDVLHSADAMRAALANMSREEAARHAARFADRLVLAMGVMREPEYLVPTVGSLIDLGPLLDHSKAARNLESAAKALAEALPEAKKPYELATSAAALAALAPKRDKDDAAREAAAARLLSDAIDNADEPDSLSVLAEALRAVSDRLEPKDAADRSGAAARKLHDALAHSPKAAALTHLVRALQRHLDALPPADAAHFSAEAAHALADAISRTAEQSEVADLAAGFEALAPRLNPDDALTTARVLTEAMSRTTYNDYHSHIGGALEAVCSRADSRDAPTRGSLAVRLVSAATPPETGGFTLAALAPELRPAPSRFSTQELAELLKWPSCVGPARAVVLARLGGQCGRTFRDQWDFVDWAEANRPTLDLTSPPGARP